MKRILFVAAFVTLASVFALGQQRNPALEAKLIQMDKDWTAAELRGDKKMASMVVADDFWATMPNGLLQNKKQYLTELKPSKGTDTADEFVVRFFGPDLAVMTHRGTIKGERNFQYRSTHVWVNRAGKWLIVAHHSSEIAPDAAAASDKAAASPKEQKKPKIVPMMTNAAPVSDAANTE
ncbi:MAG: DUF4440 domain-containing protein [Pyrinomonadaceae bacterium]